MDILEVSGMQEAGTNCSDGLFTDLTVIDKRGACPGTTGKVSHMPRC